MQTEIGEDIRTYSESVFWGLNLRQVICGILAIVAAVAVWFGIGGRFGTDARIYLCTASAIPFAAAGFAKYNGMTLEQFAWAWLKYSIAPKELKFKSNDLYLQLCRAQLEQVGKEETADAAEAAKGTADTAAADGPETVPVGGSDRQAG